MPPILCLLVLLPLASVNGEGVDSGPAVVMFYYGPEEYYWSNATAGGSADAIAVSGIAATNINRGFVYEEATGAVEIGGLRPGPNDTWKWSLLSWDANGERWVPWTRNPRDLKPQAGGAIAWSPNDTNNPTPNPLSRYPWPMFRCSASRRGETLSPAPLTNLTYWTAGLNGSVFSTPCVANGKVFILVGAELDDTTMSNSSLACLDELTGRPLWRSDLAHAGPGFSSPAYSDGKIYVGGSDGKLMALDARSGTILWRFDAGNSTFGLTCSPVVWRERIIFAAADGFIYCLKPDGTLDWKTNVSEPSDVFPGSPSVLGDKVLVGSYLGNVSCMDVLNGSVLWTVHLPGRMMATIPLSPEGYAFASAIDGNRSINRSWMFLYSLYVKNGDIQWNASYPLSLSSPALAAGGLFMGTETEFIGHHPDRGTWMWGVPFATGFASPAAARGYVFFTTYNETLQTMESTIGCLRVAGSLVWRLDVNESCLASPVVADGRLFVVTINGTVLCLGRPPEARIAGNLSSPAKASEGENVKMTASLDNTGEAPALFTVTLTVDGNLTGPGKGPFSLQPGERLNLTFGWRAVKGGHALGLSFNGSKGNSTTVQIEVGKSAEACSSVIWTAALAACALTMPSVAGRCRRKGA